ncbi:MAG: hypothetical protein H0V80_14695 [Acidobacteria bacterium]|nr:hypothetical protein [Acidobacteriota bacterium]
MFQTSLGCVLGVTCLSLALVAAQDVRTDNMNRMEHGPFVSTTIAADPLSPTRSIVVHKGIAVRVASDPEAVVTFDTDLLRVAAAWTGGGLQWSSARDGLEQWPSPAGFTHFTTAQRPGWTTTGDFADPRPWRYGPLPREKGRYKGLYVQGDTVVFAYAIGDAGILERPGFLRVDGQPVFVRTFNVQPAAEPLSLHVLQAPGAAGTVIERRMLSGDSGTVAIRAGAETRMVAFSGLPESATWRLTHQHLVLDLPHAAAPRRFEVLIGPVSTGDPGAAFEAHLRQAGPIADSAHRGVQTFVGAILL